MEITRVSDSQFAPCCSTNAFGPSKTLITTEAPCCSTHAGEEIRVALDRGLDGSPLSSDHHGMFLIKV
jgi:hypothetical protein